MSLVRRPKLGKVVADVKAVKEFGALSYFRAPPLAGSDGDDDQIPAARLSSFEQVAVFGNVLPGTLHTSEGRQVCVS